MLSGNGAEHQIPFSVPDLITMCLEAGGLAEEDHGDFGKLARILASVFHFEFHRDREILRAAFAPFDPDKDTVPLKTASEAERQAAQKTLVDGLARVLEKANYQRLDGGDLKAAISESALFKIRLAVEFDDFEDVMFYVRGKQRETAELRTWFGLRRKTVEFDAYDRVLVYVRFKEASHFPEKMLRRLPFEPGSIVLKLFRHVPSADLEILFPNVEVRMRGIDHLLIGVPAAIGGIIVLTTKLLSVIALMFAMLLFLLGMGEEPKMDAKVLFAAGAGLAAGATYVLKQISNFKNRKIRFLKTLTDQLYFKNLDNNAGVISHLITGAEDEELKEAILAYCFLLVAGKPIDTATLDERIETWFRSTWGRTLDFDENDALEKLERLGLAVCHHERWSVLPIRDALTRLDAVWDGYYEHG